MRRADCQGECADRIELTADVELTVVDNSVDGANGLPSMTSHVTLDGKGFEISRSLAAPTFRILHIAPTGALRLENATISNGVATDVSNAARGGGIYNLGDVVLYNSTLDGNSAFSELNAFGGRDLLPVVTPGPAELLETP